MTNTDNTAWWITRKEAAELLGLSLRQVHRQVRAGRIHIHRDEQTGRVGYLYKDVQSLMEERARTHSEFNAGVRDMIDGAGESGAEGSA